MGLRRKLVLVVTILAGSLMVLVGVLHLAILLPANEIRKTNAVIGSADGPVSILISEIVTFDFIMISCLGIAVAGIIYLVLSKKKP
jgi:Na+-transporting methylmalonyl-CoA/oxaloacetate decarboxylase beta subunit